jgi:hypothetical protein
VFIHIVFSAFGVWCRIAMKDFELIVCSFPTNYEYQKAVDETASRAGLWNGW